MALTHSVSAGHHSFLLDGRWIEGEPREIRSPFDQQVIATVGYAGRSDAESAIAAAERAFATTRRLPAYERQRALRAIAQGLSERREEFAAVLAREAGKPIKAARVEIDRAVFTFHIAAEEATRIYGDVLPLDLQPAATGRWAILRRFPLGPIAAITPFNFPVNLAAHKIAPAIAAGCTIVLKPPPQDPIATLMLAEVVREAGLPDGAVNVLPLDNEDADPLVTDERIKMLTFTGSGAVGWQLRQRAGKKRVTLELGGNAAVIVHGDADVRFAADRCVAGGFSYAGQSCISVQRIYVQRAAQESFLDALVAATRKLKVGDPMDDTTDVGPMIREADARRAEEWIDEAVKGGATVLCGGHRTGALLEPTVLTRTRPEMRVNCAEVFAPVVTVEPYDDFEDALRRVNDSPYGLQAGLFTRDAKLIFHAYEELQVGGVIVGDIPSWRIDHMPYGGVKESGTGREGLRYSIEEMTERKLLVMNV
ncbi:MAG TPA: aldehyde dehydrogenase family protein [Terriglobales bacterium]|nr:aldehyde dehydrogenase family protein [Terriglobales bacterium]